MSFFTDVTNSVSNLFTGSAPEQDSPLPLGLIDTMDEFVPGGGSPEAHMQAWEQYTEEPELPTGLLDSEEIDRINGEFRGEQPLPTGLLSPEQIAEINSSR